MSNHDQAHMGHMTKASVAARRAAKIRRLVETAPPLRPDQLALLHRLLDAVPQLNTSASERGADQ